MNRKILGVMVFILLLNIVFPTFQGHTAIAARDISNTNVTSLSVSPSQINDGGNTKVRVDFNDTGGKIQNGDIIKVTWPNDGNVKIEGYSKTISLDVKGQVVGQAVITPEGAQITFNEKVDKLSDVSGFAEFEVQGRNFTNTTHADTKTGTITSGNKTAKLSISKGEEGTGSVFYYKTGDMLPSDTEHVRWFLNINNEKKYVDKPITVKDQIQAGQQLDLNSISIKIDGVHSGYYTGSNAIQAFQNKIPGATMSVDENRNTIEVYIPKDYASLNNFTINYKTKITNDSQKEFVNHSQIWYQENNQPEVNGEASNYSVQNISANAGIEGTIKGELKIQKIDKETQQPIPGVKFTLTKEDGSAVKDGKTSVELTTDAQGLVNIKDLPSAKYVIKEIEAPAPYSFDKEKTYPFELRDSDTQGYFMKIDNSKSVEKTSISGEKKWDDNHNQDGKRPQSVTINLLANGKEVQSTETTQENGWKYEFKDLPKEENGKVIDYTVTEIPVEGYQTTVDGTTIINKYTPENTKVSGKKVWDDHDNQDGKRPQSVTINLLANGEQVQSKIVTNENNWNFSFNDLPKFKNGKEIVYTVTEDNVPEYSTSIQDTTITNKYTPGKTSATVTKKWDDQNNQDGKRPQSIQVELLANGKTTNKTAELNADNKWTYTWKNLDEKAQGKNIDYSVKETSKVEGYTSSIDNTNIGNVIITNKYLPENTTIEGKKIWKDKDNQDGKRPDNITVNLLANGEKIKSQSVNASSNWHYSFTDLPKFANGKAIDYTVTEDHVENYSTTIDGTTITNAYTPGKTSATVTKNWDDANNQDGKRPEAIKVELVADNQPTGKIVELDNRNNWTHTWQDLDEKSKGKDVIYSVKELTKLNEYVSSVDNSNIGNLVITNTYTPKTTQVKGKKIWKDKDNQDGKRPDHVTVNILKNGEVIDSKIVNASSNWSYTFDNLPKYENGKEINYTVTENHVENYSTTIDGTTITNAYTPGKTSATVTKNWDDANNHDGKRPEAIKVELVANGQPTGKIVELDNRNNWTHTWQDLDEKSKGKDVIYSVKELTKLNDYKVSYNNDNSGNLLINNTFVSPSKPTEPNSPNNSEPKSEQKPSNSSKSDSPTTQPETRKVTETPKHSLSNFIRELPNTGKMISHSWITWITIACIVIGVYLIVRRKK